MGTLRSILEAIAKDLYDREKRGFGIGKNKRGKGPKLIAVREYNKIPQFRI